MTQNIFSPFKRNRKKQFSRRRGEQKIEELDSEISSSFVGNKLGHSVGYLLLDVASCKNN